jgi:K+-transporting ATPase ATPase C chain
MYLKTLWSSLKFIVLSFLVLGLVYNLVIFGIGKLIFPGQANGSLVVQNHRVIGSSLIGQNFTSEKYFQGRPSATTPAYNAAASSPSNYGPTNPLLIKEIKTNLDRVLKENLGISASDVPPQLVERSASGIDPDISPQAAYLQVPRVSRLNHISKLALISYIKDNTVSRFLWIFGDSYVNVLSLNLEVVKLDHIEKQS